MYQYTYKCPQSLGYLCLDLAKQGKVTSCVFTQQSGKNIPKSPLRDALDRYFKEKKDLGITFFDIHNQGTDFQKKVWSEILKIPLGQTCTYQDIAHTLGMHRGARAVGAACGKNPLALFVPCHRVVRAHQEDHGYSWSAQRKKWLLDYEQSK